MIAIDDKTLMALLMAAIPVAMYVGVLIGALMQKKLQETSDSLDNQEELSAFPKSFLRFKDGEAKEGDLYCMQKNGKFVAYILRGEYWIEEPRIPLPEDAKRYPRLEVCPPPQPPLRTMTTGFLGAEQETAESIEASNQYQESRKSWLEMMEAKKTAKKSSEINSDIVFK